MQNFGQETWRKEATWEMKA